MIRTKAIEASNAFTLAHKVQEFLTDERISKRHLVSISTCAVRSSYGDSHYALIVFNDWRAARPEKQQLQEQGG